jgi:hypothetical protein
MNIRFSWENQNIISPEYIFHYKETTEQFCRTYYANYDHDVSHMFEYYNESSIFTFNGVELKTFNEFNKHLKNNNIKQFRHTELNIFAQPIYDTGILINVFGKIRLNDNHYNNFFMESIILKKGQNGRYVISNTIFQLLT